MMAVQSSFQVNFIGMINWITALFVNLVFISPGDWQTDMNTAKQAAEEQHKMILLNFSGSDWCGPCIRMHKEIFTAERFKQFANNSLILVNADFPRLKKNRLSPEQEEQNDHLAEQYNIKGIFPLTILMKPNGEVIRSWEGLPNLQPQEFVQQLDAALHAHH